MLCNIYALILWSVRLASSSQQINFLHSRLVRTSRPEIPRFRFEFKHVTRELGDYVHMTLVNDFLSKYLEADGYFFVRLLAVNASDFIVQEIVEQLWMVYIMKYGENDAKNAEDTFFELRRAPLHLHSFSRDSVRTHSISNTTDELTYLKPEYTKRRSNMKVELLGINNMFQPMVEERGEQV